MKMNCNTVKHKLIFYLDGELPLDEANEVQNHLEQCDDCSFYFSELSKSLSIIETGKIKETDAAFYSKLSSRLHELENNNTAFSFKEKFMQVLAYAAVIAIGIFIGLFTESKINNISESKNQETLEQLIVWNDFMQEPIESFLLTEK